MRNTSHILSALFMAAIVAVVGGCDSRDNTSTADDAKDTASDAASSAGDYIDDTAQTTKVKSALFGEDSLSGFEISVKTNDGVVELSGSVSSERERERATRVARGVDGVKSVNNRLTIE